LDPQPCSPQGHYQGATTVAVRAVAGGGHDGDDFFHLRRIGRIAQALVARRAIGPNPGSVAGDRRRAAART
jgi:hypothetical protein